MATGPAERLIRPEWTAEQRRAIGARGVSAALSAGAGCGKTFVLTERFLAELQPDDAAAAGGPNLGQLVAITFTERAAREMRQRIRQACRRQLRDAPQREAAYWLALIRDLDAARVSTIHSFCGTLLRAHAVEAGLDPQFRVLDQAQAETLFYEALDERLRGLLADRDDAVIELVVAFGLERLYDMLRTLLGQRQEIDWAAWQAESAESLVARWADYWQNDTRPRILRQVAESAAARELIEIAQLHTPSHDTMRQRCETLVARLPELPGSSDPTGDLAVVRDSAQVQGGGGKKAWESEETYGRFRDAAKKLRDTIDKVKDSLGFDAEAARPAAETALRLLALAADVAGEYDRQKAEARALDFDDLLIHARRLLVGPDRENVRRRVASQIGLLLVDEFQDTDPLQVELVKALCDDAPAGGRLFFVGDLKQSIYRFRGADPHVFRALRGEIPPEGRLPLTLNFRSQPAVLDFVNALFREELAEDDAAGPHYEALRPHRPQVGPTPAVELLLVTEEEPGPRAGQEERLRRREANWIARRLRAMLDAGEKIVWDAEAAQAGTPAVRAVRPGDVTLLFRALSNVDLYEEALRRYGIDYYLVGGHAYYAQQEIYDLLNVLRAIASPCDEVSLVGALRSPMFGLFDETLFWLARHGEGLSGGLMAEALPPELDAPQRDRVERAAGILGALRARKDRVPTAELIGEAVAQTGYDATLLAEFLGPRKLANLRKLIEQARSFDRSGVFTLADFITQLSQFVAQQPKEPLAATHPESTDVVRLMTVHQSKGLEFPVVVVPDLDRKRRPSTASVAFTRRLGPMVRDPSPAGQAATQATTGLDLHLLAEADEDRAELARLLYVATTRAADRLILSAGLPKLDGTRGPWLELVARRFDLETGVFRGDGASEETASDDLRIRVTTTEPPLPARAAAEPGRMRLGELIERARQTAERGEGRVPRYLAAVPVDLTARRQYSFSRLHGTLVRQQPDNAAPTLPFASTIDDSLDVRRGVDPLGLGTLVHAVLAEIDFRQPGDVEAIVRRHAPRHLPDATADALAEPIDLARRFLASDRAAAMAAAAELHAELEFLLPWPPGDAARGPDPRYLQGFIDCLYRDAAGEWHLVDYKTNRASAETLAGVAAGYEMQMLLYALATEQILGRPPVELVLCFLRPGLEHRFAWDDAARRRVRALVDGAIASHNG